MHVYCLYGRSDRCKAMATTLERQGALRAFSPQVINFVWKDGVRRDVRRDLLTGYVFAFYEDRLPDFHLFYSLEGFIRKVGDSTMNYELRGNDLDFALALYDEDGVIRRVHAVWEENYTFIRIDDDILSRYQAKVVYMDKRKKRAKIEFRFEDILFTAWVALDLEDRPEGYWKLAEGESPAEPSPEEASVPA